MRVLSHLWRRVLMNNFNNLWSVVITLMVYITICRIVMNNFIDFWLSFNQSLMYHFYYWRRFANVIKIFNVVARN
uniref:Hypothetical secreted peptide n=1 Tax=Glossina morsitans morsitans TaxID=37546 RepID=D3TSR4_GLOMM